MTDLQKAIAIDGLRSSDKEDRRFLRRLAVDGDITLLDTDASPFDIEKIRNGAIHFNLWYVSPQDAAVIKRKLEEERQHAMDQQHQRQEQEAEERKKRKLEKALARKQRVADMKSAGLWTHPQYKTLRAARADGWHNRREEEVGGEEITLKGHTLVRNTTMLRYVYKTTLSKTYGMTPSMIEELGTADKYVPNPHYQTGPDASLYLVERVETWIEDNQERIKKAQESRPVRSAAMKGVHKKKQAERWQKALEWVEQLSITVNRPLPTTLLADARKHFTIPDKVDLLTNKALLAHVRHRETNYESLLQDLYEQEFSNELYPLLRQRIDPLVQKAVVEWHASIKKVSA